MAKTVTISRAGHLVGATGPTEALRALAQSFVKVAVTGPLPGVTDNSGGVPNARKELLLGAPVAAVAANGSNLATVGAVNSGLSSLRDALRTLTTSVNAVAIAVGFTPITFNGGGADGAGTIGAVSTTVAGATTGASGAASTAAINAYNAALYSVATLVNRLAEATGDDLVKISGRHYDAPLLGTIPALPVDVGAAGGSGVTAASWQAALENYQDDLATVAALLNAVTSPGTVRLIAIR